MSRAGAPRDLRLLGPANTNELRSNVTREKIDVFIEEFKEVRGDMGRMPPQDDKSPLSQLSSSSWGGGTYVAPMDLKAE